MTDLDDQGEGRRLIMQISSLMSHYQKSSCQEVQKVTTKKALPQGVQKSKLQIKKYPQRASTVTTKQQLLGSRRQLPKNNHLGGPKIKEADQRPSSMGH